MKIAPPFRRSVAEKIADLERDPGPWRGFQIAVDLPAVLVPAQFQAMTVQALALRWAWIDGQVGMVELNVPTQQTPHLVKGGGPIE